METITNSNKFMRQRIILIFLCCLLGFANSFSQKLVETNYFSANPKLGGEVMINKSTKEVVGEFAKISFEVNAPTAGEYNVYFWMFPTKLKNGNYSEYQVEVNGKKLDDKIIPTIGDWQSITLSSKSKISLVEGNNIITIVGKVPDVPNVEHIKLSKNNSTIDASKYNTFKTQLEKENLKNNKGKQVLVVSTDTIDTFDQVLKAATTSDAPLYDFTYRLNMSFNYTFYKTVSFTKDQKIFISTSGIDNFTHILEFFSATTPESYSWSAISNSNCSASLNITIPVTGMYYVRVRSYLNARSGFCNLNINGENYYERVPLYSTGIRCTQDTGNEYNTFTCYNEGDPRLWIEEGSGIPGKISAFNDDYGSHGGDYVWGLNSRIKKKYDRTVHSALLSAYSSYNPTGKCDLYIKCKNSTVMSYFPNLKADDAIQSAPSSYNYNCISWSGKITSYWEWPPSPSSSYYDPDPLKAFDKFYASLGYTRTGATKSNAVVALWAIVDSYGNREYTHASVRKGDGNAHGYDWESKPGSLMRTFHPCDALIGDDYGEIVEYYTTTTNSTQKTMAEEISDGTTTVEYIEFNSEESSLIENRINSIPYGIKESFNTLYNDWLKITNNTIFSNPNQIIDCKEYKSIYDFCNTNPESIYMLYDKLSVGDFAAVILIENLNLVSPNREAILREIRNESSSVSRSGAKVVRPILSNITAYVKKLLENENPVIKTININTAGNSGLQFSNSHEFSISSIANSLDINFVTTERSKVVLQIMDVYGQVIACPLNGNYLEAGSHNYSLSAPTKGTYLVELVINGKTNVKKVFIK